ncbi:ketopantoate reductase [Pseudomonas reinekei]|jgi:2-dehydropantoate 2-reductase|nr:ketopantoate reductase family protein [Pseudomonas reinekei]OLU04340.1 hypothetical protein BVK86_08865 [Pseudomonas reinekei]SDO33324.1 ketopantoate reductase [Pseudomonas reinekei]
MEVVIIGAGAMGCLFAAKLQHSGASVRLVEVDEPTVSAIAVRGIEVTCGGLSLSQFVPITRADQTHRSADLIVVFTKGLHTRQAIDSVRHLLTDTTWVLTLQNGLGNAQVIAQLTDPDRLAVGMTDVPADLAGPGQVSTADAGEIRFWSYSKAYHPILGEFQNMLCRAGFQAAVDEGVVGHIWEKVAFNAALNGLCTLLDCRVELIGMSQDARWIATRAVAECEAVAHRLGIPFRSDQVLARMEEAFMHQADHIASMLQDRRAGRRTEIESINGGVIRLADEMGVDAPVLKTLYHLVRFSEPSS